MNVVLVSSPGRERELHWSHAAAGEMAAQLVTAGAQVSWLAVVRPGQTAPPTGGVLPRILTKDSSSNHDRAAADGRHLPVELALTELLRATPIRRVVHVGAGARGSPNVNWLADRLGATTFAVVRAAEVVCHRGDLVHADGQFCLEFLDAERCRRCCQTNWWRHPSVAAFRNRSDLLAASLLAAAVVFVRDDEDASLLVRFGLPARSLEVVGDPQRIAARVCQ